MPQTQVNCPQCRQPFLADVQQLFDVGENPQEKQLFLAGAFNIAKCPHCGFEGMLSMPLVYHDPSKELLLTYFPPEIGLAFEEQNKSIGPLINKVVNNLPQEKRKGYLFSPKTMLTIQVMLETILEADGITKEMIKAQEERMNLIQKLLAESEDTAIETIHSEDEMIDGDFFRILSRLMEAAFSSQDEKLTEKLTDLQNLLFENSTKGKELDLQRKDIEETVKSLQEFGEGITREDLLELVVKSDSDTKLRTIARLARPGLDYLFFQQLSERIDRARPKGRIRLINLREKLLEYTEEIDKDISHRSEIAMKNVETLLQADDIKSALEQNLAAVDEFFIQAVTQSLEKARKEGDLDHSARLQQILDVINELSSPPEEFKLIEKLIEVADDKEKLISAINQMGDEITPELIEMANMILAQTLESIKQVEGEDKTEQQEVLERLQAVYDGIVGFSMRRNLSSS